MSIFFLSQLWSTVCCFPIPIVAACRDTAEQLLYRLRELEEDPFVRISHNTGLGPIDFGRVVFGNISVSAQL
jgi:hypothetical protein